MSACRSRDEQEDVLHDRPARFRTVDESLVMEAVRKQSQEDQPMAQWRLQCWRGYELQKLVCIRRYVSLTYSEIGSSIVNTNLGIGGSIAVIANVSNRFLYVASKKERPSCPHTVRVEYNTWHEYSTGRRSVNPARRVTVKQAREL